MILSLASLSLDHRMASLKLILTNRSLPISCSEAASEYLLCAFACLRVFRREAQKSRARHEIWIKTHPKRLDSRAAVQWLVIRRMRIFKADELVPGKQGV